MKNMGSSLCKNKQKGNDQELIQSHPTSHPQYQSSYNRFGWIINGPLVGRVYLENDVKIQILVPFELGHYF